MRKIFAITYALIIGITTTAMIMSGVATPTYAAVNSCPSSPQGSCQAGGIGQQGGGFGIHETCTNAPSFDCIAGVATFSGGGAGGSGGGHQVVGVGGIATKCVGKLFEGSICPP